MYRRLFFLAMLSVAALAGGTLHAQSRGPLLSVTPSPVDFDTVFCGTSRCMEVLFRNDGDTALTIHSFDALASPFHGALPAPLTLAPGESRSVDWCYTPTRVMTRDSVTVRFISDNRIPYSMGLLVDASTAMGAAMPGASTAIQAARAALGGFVGTMMADGSPPHEGAVFTYSTSSQFRLLRGLTDQRSLVEGALPGAASGPHACVWQGMDRAISLMAAAKHRQVLVVVNGSEDAGVGNCGPYSAPGVASAALAADMIVCAISVNGAAQGPLADIAAQTGGLFRSAASADDLAQAMHDIMLHLQRSVRQHLVVRGEVVSPALAFTPDALLFPTTPAGDTARATVWLHNVGTAPMDLGRVEGETGVFGFAMTPRQVPPGDSIAAELAYHPSDQGYAYTAVSVAINGCVPDRPELRLHGLCLEDVNPTLGPVLANAPRDIDAGRIPCDTGGELVVPLRNAGDVVLDAFMPLVQHARVSSPAQDSWRIGADSETPISLQLRPGGVPGPDSCGFAVSVRTRRTARTVLLIDAASSLRMPWLGLDGAAMARLLVGRLAAGLSSTAEIRDSMAVLSAAKENVMTLQDFTADRRQLAALAPLPGSSDTTALLDGVDRALDLLTGRSGLRRLVVFTTGSTDLSTLTGGPGVDALLRKAEAADVRVAVFHIDRQPLSDSLRALVTASGGEIFTPDVPAALVAATGDIEHAAIDTVRISRMIRWQIISSDQEITPATQRIAESHVGETVCADFIVRNTGQSALSISDVTSPTQGFSIATSLPLTVAVGAQATLRLCYTPAVLGPWSVDAEVRGNSCVNPTVAVRMEGEATDSNTATIGGILAVRPGGLVTLPLRLAHMLPVAYDVRHMTIAISYEPSLLYPDMERPLAFPVGEAVSYDVTVAQEYDRASGMAVSRYDIRARAGGVPLLSPGPSAPLFSLRLRAFLGRVAQTDVRLREARFPGHPVALGAGGTATVHLDSMLWLEQRLIDATALWGTLGKCAPHPLHTRGSISYTLTDATPVRLVIHDLLGRPLRVLFDGAAEPGTHDVAIDVTGLPAGAYICTLHGSRGTLSRVILVSSLEETR